ncbi:MAG: hypothetical protein AVDCRST_MAG66-3826, partial [uncultured Pseudonocardia sp.]
MTTSAPASTASAGTAVLDRVGPVALVVGAAGNLA